MARTGRIDLNAKHQVSKTLFGAGVVHILPSLLYWPVTGFHCDVGDVIGLGGFIVFVTMAVCARWLLLLSAIICAMLYALLLGFELLNVAEWGVIVWVLNLCMIILLFTALFAAMKQQKVSNQRLD
jgi:hypothetical protein